MRIAVCDDNVREVVLVKQFLFQMKADDLKCEFFKEPIKLLELLRSGNWFDLYILDIEMPVVSGIELAHQIREVDKKALLVFLTSYTKYMVDVFEVVTFDYLVKPVSADKIVAVVDKARSYLNMTKRSFSFSYRRNCYNLKFEDILYLEKKGRQAIIYTEDEIYQANMNLSEIWEQLDVRMFTAIHGSYIVNLNHVLSFSGGVATLTDGTKLVVTRGYRKEFGEKFITFVRGGM